MKTILLIIACFTTNFTFSQVENCGIEQIQLEICKFVLENINEINTYSSEKKSQIEISIHFKDVSNTSDLEKIKVKLKDINYYLIVNNDSSKIEDKKRIKANPKLDNLVKEKINACITESTSFNKHIYENITFRVPLDQILLSKFIKQLNLMGAK